MEILSRSITRWIVPLLASGVIAHGDAPGVAGVLARPLGTLANHTEEVRALTRIHRLNHLTLLELCRLRWFELATGGLAAIELSRLNDHLAGVGLNLFLNAEELRHYRESGRVPKANLGSFVERHGFNIRQLVALRSMQIQSLADLEGLTTTWVGNQTTADMKAVFAVARALGLFLPVDEKERLALVAGRLDPRLGPLARAGFGTRVTTRLRELDVWNLTELGELAASGRLNQKLGPAARREVEAYLCASRLTSTAP